MTSIISDLLEVDFYKINMWQMVLHQYPDVRVKYEFFNRGGTRLHPDLHKYLRREVDSWADIKLTQERAQLLAKQATHLDSHGFLPWLCGFQPNPFLVSIDPGTGYPTVEGPWHKTIWFETSLMAAISELHFSLMGCTPGPGYESKAAAKAKLLKEAGLTFVDYGLRRRFSAKVHRKVYAAMLAYIKRPGDAGGLAGTSNVALALETGTKFMGTIAHEPHMVAAAVHGFQSANERILAAWQNEFHGDLGTALPDTFTSGVFMRSFDATMAKAFDSIRHDSGDPFTFVDKWVAFYEQKGIDPMSKTIIFSDGLSPERAIQIARYCEGKIKCAFGIGTNFTNDVGHKPLNIVIKVTHAGREGWPMLPTIKLSDEPGKVTGDPKVAAMAKYLLGIN